MPEINQDSYITDRSGMGNNVFQDAANIIEGHLRQSRVLVAREQRLAFLPKTLVGVHPRAIVAIKRLRHERHCFPMPTGDVFDDVFVIMFAFLVNSTNVEIDNDYKSTSLHSNIL